VINVNMTIVRLVAVVGLLQVGVVQTLSAQRAVGADREAAGWIGISFEISQGRRGGDTQVVITDVSAGSPAEIAGLHSGDQLLAINELDTPNELSELTELLHLSAGDRVVMEIERDGRSRKLALHAAVRPDGFAVSRSMEFSLQSDSMVETWVRAMDSLRVQLVEGRGRNVRIARVSATAPVVRPDHARSVRAPFEFFVFRGEDHDSLRQEMVDVNQVMAELQVRLGEREHAFGVDDAARLADDREFIQLRVAMDEATSHSNRLRAAMALAARTTAGLEYARLAPQASPGFNTPDAPGREFRPLTPYLLGRNRVAGAEVVDLKPELAEYFEVAGGVLVVSVAPGTPASIAGIIPGDVIIRLNEVSVRSVEDLRFGVSQAGQTLPITLIRRGTSIQVLLRR
jgi:membrane-associated protease RseP (regulator of RpoE activity)